MANTARRTFRTLRRIWSQYPLPSALIVFLVLVYAVVALPSTARIFPGAGLFVLSVWFVFRAPNTCGAVNRDGTRCRNNAKGLLRGCHLIEHKRQNVIQRLRASVGWAGPHVRDSIKTTIEILGALGSFAGGVFGVLSYFAG